MILIPDWEEVTNRGKWRIIRWKILKVDRWKLVSNHLDSNENYRLKFQRVGKKLIGNSCFLWHSEEGRSQDFVFTRNKNDIGKNGAIETQIGVWMLLGSWVRRKDWWSNFVVEEWSFELKVSQDFSQVKEEACLTIEWHLTNVYGHLETVRRPKA